MLLLRVLVGPVDVHSIVVQHEDPDLQCNVCKWVWVWNINGEMGRNFICLFFSVGADCFGGRVDKGRPLRVNTHTLKPCQCLRASSTASASIERICGGRRLFLINVSFMLFDPMYVYVCSHLTSMSPWSARPPAVM